MSKINLCGLTLFDVQVVLLKLGEDRFRAGQLFRWVYQKGIRDFSAMTDLAPLLRQRLAQKLSFGNATVAARVSSRDGTIKLLCRLSDGHCVEAVMIPAEGRVTACLSTQVGCKFACSFCASGAGGFKRNLETGEIIEQLLLVKECAPQHRLTHVVFMGTGEPLDNYENVISAIRFMNAKETFGIGARRITISTSGVIPGMKRLAQEGLQIELSVSLHAATEERRRMLMPINKKYPLAALIPACTEYTRVTKRQITFEYTLIRGVNADARSAQALSMVLRRVPLAKVNLIPVNPVRQAGVVPPGKLEMLTFKNVLVKNGIPVTVRKERGADIEAACGQLRLRHEATI